MRRRFGQPHSVLPEGDSLSPQVLKRLHRCPIWGLKNESNSHSLTCLRNSWCTKGSLLPRNAKEPARQVSRFKLLGKKKARSLPTACVSQSSRLLKVPTRMINARHSFPLDYRALSALPQRPPQAEPAPTSGEGPAGGLLET